MAIFVTGDMHGMIEDLSMRNFPAQKEMNKFDYVIICGDFGFIWSKEETKEEKYLLDWLNTRNFTVLFVDGNHENYDRLETYPISEWNGGKVQFIRPSVIHLMRGQVYEIEGKTFATMGGAPSHDIDDGIFYPEDYVDRDELNSAIRKLIISKGGYRNAYFRVKGLDWWEQEIPTSAEWNEFMRNLSKYDFKVDFVLTHEAPASVIPFISPFEPTDMSKQLEDIRAQLTYGQWYFAHYHQDRRINEKDNVIYHNVQRIV